MTRMYIDTDRKKDIKLLASVAEKMGFNVHFMPFKPKKYFSIEDCEPNQETLDALQEAKCIASGKIKMKSYSSHKELFAELEAEARKEMLAERRVYA